MALEPTTFAVTSPPSIVLDEDADNDSIDGEVVGAPRAAASSSQPTKPMPWMRQRKKQPNTVKKKNRLKKLSWKEAPTQEGAADLDKPVVWCEEEPSSEQGPTAPSSHVELEIVEHVPVTPQPELPSTPTTSLTQRVRLNLSVTDTSEWHSARLQQAWQSAGLPSDLHFMELLLLLLLAHRVRRTSVFAAEVVPAELQMDAPVPDGAEQATALLADGLLYRLRARAPAADPTPPPPPRVPGFVVVVQLTGDVRGVHAVYLGLVLDSHARVWSTDDWAVTAACLVRADPAVPICHVVAPACLPPVKDEARDLACSGVLALRLLVDQWVSVDPAALTLQLGNLSDDSRLALPPPSTPYPAIPEESAWVEWPLLQTEDDSRTLLRPACSSPFFDVDPVTSPSGSRPRSAGEDMPLAAKIPRRTRSLDVREPRPPSPRMVSIDASRSPSPPLPAMDRASSLSVPSRGEDPRPRRQKARARSILTGHRPHPPCPPRTYKNIGGDAVAFSSLPTSLPSGERVKRRAKRRRTDCGGGPLLLTLDGEDGVNLDKAACAMQ